MEIKNIFDNNTALEPFTNLITQIMELDDANLSNESIDIIQGMLSGAFTPAVREQAINTMIQSFHEDGLRKSEVAAAIEELKGLLAQFIDELEPSEMKKKLLNSMFEIFTGMFDEACDRYLTSDIELPIKLEKDAHAPTYAHITDAAADLYALETVTLPAHSISNKIRTGVQIALPEGWMGMIFPRSSMGAKTGLRLSNSAGIIDQAYTGELGVLYDNISDSDYTINAGDRIAQFMVMPSYHFKAQIVDILPATDRGENGFGSSGK